MIAPRYLLLITMLAMQTGCAILTSYNSMESQVAEWIDSKQYGRALEALSSVDPTDPEYLQSAERRKEVEALAARYEQEVRRQTRSDLNNGKWAQALDTYDEALARLPKSAVLKDGLAQLHREQAEELDRLELKRLLDHGAWLQQTLPTYQQIARFDPRNRTAAQRLEAIQSEAGKIAKELALFGNKALANDRIDIANRTLSLAAELSKTPAIAESLKKLRQQQDQAKAIASKQRAKTQARLKAAERNKAKQVDEYLKKYQEAFAKKDFLNARDHLNTLQQADSRNPKWKTLSRKLDEATAREVERLFESGVSTYSRGNFEQAAALWNKSLELAPDHKQARESLERAQRVLEKLEELKSKRTGDN